MYLFVCVCVRVVGDGDSNVIKRLNEVLPYGPNFFIQKIECRNHLLRNYAMKLNAMTKKVEYPIGIRKFISSNLLRFRSDITKAISYRKENCVTLQLQVSGNYNFL